MHNICTVSSPVPITMQNTVQVPWIFPPSVCAETVEGKLSSPYKLCHTVDSDLEAFNASANSFCHLSVYELHSNQDFNHLCVRAVDALESLELCLWLLRGVSGSC